MYGFKLGIDYPKQIIDVSLTGKLAKEKLFALADTPDAKRHASKLLSRLVRTDSEIENQE